MKRSLIALAAISLTLASIPAVAQYRAPGALPAQAPQAGKRPDSRPVIKVCTGRQDGVYWHATQALARKAGANFLVQPVLTEGSMENVQRVTEGQCDVAFAQNDAIRVYKEIDGRAATNVERGMSLYKEMVHLLCNRSAGISKLSDLRKGNVVAAGTEGTGANIVWQALLAAHKERYKDIEISPKVGLRALTAIQDGSEVTCTLYVGGLGNSLLKKDAQKFADKVVLVPVNEGFDDAKDAAGRPIYSYEAIPNGTYGSLMPSGSLWGTTQVKTVAVDAVFIANAQWVEQHANLYDTVLRAVTNALPEIRAKAGE